MSVKETKEQQKEIDISRVVSHLNHLFAEAIARFERPVSPYSFSEGTVSERESNSTYRWQVKFCYLLNEIVRGPKYIVPKIIADANELIDEIKQTVIKEENTKSTA